MQGLDIETTALDPEEGRVRLVQIRDGAHGRVYDGDPAVLPALRAVDQGVADNAPFERSWIARHYRMFLDLHDTMVMSQVLYTGTDAARAKQFSHSLQAVAKRELKRELDKTEQSSNWETILTEEQIRYAALDAHVLPDLASALLRKIDRAGLGTVYELERRVSHAVDAMERNGFGVDLDRLNAFIEETTEQAERLKAELEEEWGINPGSSKQLREYFGLEKRENWPVTPAGAPKTDQEAMAALADEAPEISKWLEWKRVEKLRSTYGKSLQKQIVNGRIHARFHAFGTATGRFSSSNPNLQNIPKRGDRGERLRGLFWSGSDDRVLIKADYASIELWVAAVRWKDPYMQKALQQGVNMHVATAAAFFGVKPGEVTKVQKATGKIVNFALLYGGSPKRILEEFTKNGIPIDEEGAEAMHRKFFDTYKGFARRKEAGRATCNASESDDGYHEARTAIGRRRNFADQFGPLLNHEIQGTGADSLPYPTI